MTWASRSWRKASSGPEQLDLLREMGCLLGQGYLIARPMAASEVAALAGSEIAARSAPEPSPLRPGLVRPVPAPAPVV